MHPQLPTHAKMAAPNADSCPVGHHMSRKDHKVDRSRREGRRACMWDAVSSHRSTTCCPFSKRPRPEKMHLASNSMQWSGLKEGPRGPVR